MTDIATIEEQRDEPPDRLYWSTRFNVQWRHTAEGFIEAGRILIEAKEGENRLPHGEFLAMVEEDLACSPRTAQRLMAIARHPVLSNTALGSHLPPSWRTMSELERLPAQTLLAKIEDGTVNPSMQRKDAFGLISGDAAGKHKTKMTAVDRLKEEKEELEREKADLEEQVTNAEARVDETPLSVLGADVDVEIIVVLIIDAVHDDEKAKAIAAGIIKHYKKPPGRPKKAGTT